MAFGGNGSCAGVHAAAVPPNRVDLSVMRQGAQRLRPIPGGQHVGGVALVKDGKRRGKALPRRLPSFTSATPPTCCPPGIGRSRCAPWRITERSTRLGGTAAAWTPAQLPFPPNAIPSYLKTVRIR